MKFNKFSHLSWVLSLIFVLLAPLWAHSQVMAEIIPTPRGEEIQVTVFYGDGTGPTLFVALDQSCQENPLWFQSLSEQAPERRFTLVYFQWAYCRQPAGAPSANLSDEIEDFQTAYKYALHAALVNPDRFVFAGKSLGSRVAYNVFRGTPEVKGLALLSPLCSQIVNGRAVPKVSENYPQVRSEKRRILATLGLHDTNCQASVMKSYLSKNRARLVSHSGNGEFQIYNNDRELDETATQWLTEEIMKRVLNWAETVAPASSAM